ncbi:MAG: enoyl-CoA hydratase/isomerase family protein [Gemmobacter sp.]
MTDTILTETRGRVRLITLNRPEKLNAWNRPMRQALVAALRAADADGAIGALVVTGTGERAFGAGQDLAEARRFDVARAAEWIGEWEELYGALRAVEKPVIAALNGVAAGSAFQFALLCDLRVAHDGVTMGQPEINAGIPSTTGPWAMMDKIGLAHTIDLTLTGRMLDATECWRLGLISRLVARTAVLETALALAADLAEKPPVAMRLNKRRFREITEPAFRDALAAGIRSQTEAYGTGEPQRMMERFLAARGGHG